MCDWCPTDLKNINPNKSKGADEQQICREQHNNLRETNLTKTNQGMLDKQNKRTNETTHIIISKMMQRQKHTKQTKQKQKHLNNNKNMENDETTNTSIIKSKRNTQKHTYKTTKSTKTKKTVSNKETT